MSWLRFFRRKTKDDDLAAEIDSYVQHEIDVNIARGMSPQDARDAAQRRFGNTTSIREVVYEMNSIPSLEILWQDFRYGIRQLLNHPGFAITAVLSLALGIGANTAIFTLTDQIMLRLLPVKDPQELVQLRMEEGRVGSQSGDGRHTFSYPLFRALRDRNTVFSGVTGQVGSSASLVGEDRSEMVNIALVPGNFFHVLGVQPCKGRLLTPDDDKEKNGSPVVVLQYDFWRTQYGARENIVGSKIRLNGSPFEVVGIAAPGFEGTDVGLPVKLWTPIMMKPVIQPTSDPKEDFEDERYAWYYVFARMKPGIAIEKAQAEFAVFYKQRQQEELRSEFFQKFPELKERFLRANPTLIPAARGQSALRQRFEKPLVVLQWLVGVVLLIACTNVANLLLARAAARQKEVAIRGALGASRGQLIRQLMAESLMLALAGGVMGLLICSWLAKGLTRFLPYDPANVSLATTPDLRVLLFTTAVTLLTAFIFGLVPAMQGSRVSPGATLKQEAGSIAGGHGHVRLRKFLVGFQVGLSCMLLIGAGLFARTMRNLQNVDLGMNIENVVMFGVRPATVYDEARKLQVFRDVLQGLASVPGVKSAGANSVRLLTGGRWDSFITMPGVEPKEGNQPWSFFNAISPGYFETLGIPVKMGRDFTWSDWGSGRKLCLVNEALVKEYLNGESPVGRQLGQGMRATPETEIIGVFGNSRYHDVRGETPRQIFVNMDWRVRGMTSINVYARAQGDPRQVMPQLRERVRQIDSNLVVFDMRLLDEQLNTRLANERLLSFLSMGFALLATLLAIIGLHGVLAFVVVRRTREIGIRMALGAEQGSVIGLVLKEMTLVIVLGVICGVGVAYYCGRFVETQLFGLKASDPLVFAFSTVVMLIAALGAAFLPAWRASRIDPMRALRYE